jgi:dimethylglycine dehydrogenase
MSPGGLDQGSRMKAHYRVVVIGGGVVGASVLYHLTKFGWTDVALVERSVLTAGSSWHAAGGFHALNANPNMALLQAYTIDLLKEVEAESGQPIGMHVTGGMSLLRGSAGNGCNRPIAASRRSVSMTSAW